MEWGHGGVLRGVHGGMCIEECTEGDVQRGAWRCAEGCMQRCT